MQNQESEYSGVSAKAAYAKISLIYTFCKEPYNLNNVGDDKLNKTIKFTFVNNCTITVVF